MMLNKILLLLSFVFISNISFSQSYKCDFDRYNKDTKIDSRSSTHVLNNETTIDYHGGYEVTLETSFQDGSLNYIIEITKYDETIAYFDLWTPNSPSEFLVNYRVNGFEGQCECKKQN